MSVAHSAFKYFGVGMPYTIHYERCFYRILPRLFSWNIIHRNESSLCRNALFQSVPKKSFEQAKALSIGLPTLFDVWYINIIVSWRPPCIDVCTVQLSYLAEQVKSLLLLSSLCIIWIIRKNGKHDVYYWHVGIYVCIDIRDNTQRTNRTWIFAFLPEMSLVNASFYGVLSEI